MVFKEAQISDMDSILSTLKTVAIELRDKNISQWTQWLNPQTSDIRWIQDKIESHSFFFVFMKNEMAGMFSLSDSDEKYWGHQTEKAKYLHSLTTLPEFKGTDFGKKVIQKIKTDLATTDYKYLRLDCISTNAHLKNYYQSQGFKHLKTIQIMDNSFLLHQFELK